MVEWIKGRFDKVRSSKVYNLVAGIMFPLLLIIYSFIKVNKGLDITDSAYSLSNFRNLADLDGMWFYSTFYANLLGGLFYLLPFGHTMLGMRIYTCLVKCALGLLSYFFFVKEIKLPKFYSFLSALVALGLCWCPETILYNYLTYLLFGLGVILFYNGIVKDSNVRLVVAGFVLGSNIFVRLPNVVEAGLIVAFWIYAGIRKIKFSKVMNKTLLCILGYIFAFVPAGIGIIATRGIGAYVKGISELMAMTSEAPDYSTMGMMIQLVRSYCMSIPHLAIVGIAGVFAIAGYFLLNKFNKAIAELFAGGSGIVAAIILYKKGVFTRHYQDYSAMIGISKVVIMIMFIFIIAKLFDKSIDDNKKFLMLLTIMVGLITPVGSNNDVYSLINNLFFMIPVTAMLLWEVKPKIKVFYPVYIFLISIIVVFCYQGIRFGARFVFRDGQEAPFSTTVENNEVIKNMITTEDNARRLAEVTDVFEQYNLKGSELLLYGNVSGMGFYLDCDMAISTAWPSLPSFSTQKFDEDIQKLDKEGVKPVALISKAEYDSLMSDYLTKKQEILKEYLINNDYSIIYDNEVFVVMLAK